MSEETVKLIEKLRKFGLFMALALAVIGGLLVWRGKPVTPYVVGISAFFLLSGLLFPRILVPVEWVWMKFAEVLSAVMTRIILTVTFYLAITPTGVLLRVFGKDFLKIKRKPDRESYWEPAEPDGPGSRYDKPY